MCQAKRRCISSVPNHENVARRRSPPPSGPPPTPLLTLPSTLLTLPLPETLYSPPSILHTLNPSTFCLLSSAPPPPRPLPNAFSSFFSSVHDRSALPSPSPRLLASTAERRRTRHRHRSWYRCEYRLSAPVAPCLLASGSPQQSETHHLTRATCAKMLNHSMTIQDKSDASVAWGGFPFHFHLALYGAVDSLARPQPLGLQMPSEHLFKQSSTPQTLGKVRAGNSFAAHSLGESATTTQEDGTNGVGMSQTHT